MGRVSFGPGSKYGYRNKKETVEESGYDAFGLSLNWNGPFDNVINQSSSLPRKGRFSSHCLEKASPLLNSMSTLKLSM